MPEFFKDGDTGGFRPIADQNHNLVIHSNQSTLYRRVDYRGAIAPHQCINLASVAAPLAAAAIGAATPITNLDMPDNELAQLRWYIQGNAQVYMSLPGIPLSQLKNLQAPYDMNTPLRDPNLVSTEMFVWEDNRPTVRAVNGMSGLALTYLAIIVAGWRYHTVDLEKLPAEAAASLYNSKGAKVDGPTLIAAIKSGVEPAAHVWVSGRGQGD